MAVIIGFLASIAIPNFVAVRMRAYKASMMSDLKNLAHHQEVHRDEKFGFADERTELGATESEGVTISIDRATANRWAGTVTHAAVPGQQCGIHHGNAAQASGAPASQPRVAERTP